MIRYPRLLCLLVLFALSTALHAQTYTSVVVFGDSLSDTGNIAHLTESGFGLRYPGPLFNYADGRFTDSTATVPATSAHIGVWVEQLAALLPTHPAVTASLDGGTDYAYGDATTADGTTTITETTGVSITLNNMGQQGTDYLTAHPTVPAGTLVIVWGGANDLSAAATATTPQQVQTIVSTAVANEVALVQRLIAAGATDVLVPNLPPLGLIPRFNGNATLSAAATAAAVLFNSGLQSGLNGISGSHTGAALHLYQLDTFTLFNSAAATPGSFGLTNITAAAQGQATANPDQYLFWDDLHPTTTGHSFLAAAANTLLTPPALVATTTTVTSSASTANLGSSITFTATVSSSAVPAGAVTFTDSNTTLGTGTLAATGATTATATFSTSSLAAGTHSITATYGGGAGFAASTSSTLTQTVVAPAISATLSPTTLTVNRGESGTTQVTMTPTGGFMGTVTVSCSSLPIDAGCSTDAPAGGAYSITDDLPKTGIITLTTRPSNSPTPALILLPVFGLGALALRRAKLGARLLVAVAVLSAFGLLGLSGCGDSGKRTPVGTYSVSVNVTPSSGGATTLNLTLIVK